MTYEPIRPIRSEADYVAALADFETYFDIEPTPGTSEADRFELLGMVIEKYEDSRYPIPAVEPAEVVRSVMNARGFKQSDLAALIGASRASELLKGLRPPSIEQIRKLHAKWGIPVNCLLGEMADA